MKFGELAARIKWKSVLWLALAIALVILIVWASTSVKLFSSGYQGEGEVQMRTWADPGRVDLAGKGKVWVDVRNTGDEPVDIEVLLSAYSKSLSFTDSGTQEVNKSDRIGPRESRQYDFRIDFAASDGGKYGLKVLVMPGEIEDEVFFDVYKK